MHACLRKNLSIAIAKAPKDHKSDGVLSLDRAPFATLKAPRNKEKEEANRNYEEQQRHLAGSYRREGQVVHNSDCLPTRAYHCNIKAVT